MESKSINQKKSTLKNFSTLIQTFTKTDKIIELGCFLILIAIWGLVIQNYPILPERIPMHYNMAGKVDRFGGRTTIFALPILTTVLYIGLTLLYLFPKQLKYPLSITLASKQLLFITALRMIRYLKLIIVVLFGYILYEDIQYSNETSNGLGFWFLPVTIVVICLPTIYFIFMAMKLSSKS
jgi:uncharacterized membrane protein